jgi:hypothetical protein
MKGLYIEKRDIIKDIKECSQIGRFNNTVKMSITPKLT